MKPRDQKVTVQIEQANHAWLWRERRQRERSIAWIVNQAISQYRERLERSRTRQRPRDDPNDDDDGAEPRSRAA